ncbi:hypothetical protein D3C81_357520 [compost metagenome]
MAHHRQEVGLGPVGLLSLLAGLDQLRHRLLLFMAGLRQGAGEVIDVPGQVAQFTVVDHGQGGIEVALLDGFYGIAHITDRLGQAPGQSAGQKKSEEQGEQGEDRGLDHDFFLALAKCIIGHTDYNPPQVVVSDVFQRLLTIVKEVVVQADLLQADGGLEHFDLLGTVVVLIRLLDVHQNMVAAVLNFEEAYMRDAQGRAHQTFQNFVVSGDHSVLRCRRQLVGDQLTGVIELLAQVLDAHEGKEADQQQGQQQGRPQTDDLCAGMDVPAQATPHGLRSPSASVRAARLASMDSMPKARATCWLPTTLKCSGYSARGHLLGDWSSRRSSTANQSS